VQRVLGFFAAALRGPAGGMLACVLLAAMLGGIAMANPDMKPPGGDGAVARGGASHGGGTAVQGSETSVSGPAQDHPGVDVHTAQDCRAIVEHLQGDLAAGNHGGLAQAIDVVDRNCRRNADSPGLLRALDRLVANAERFADRHGEKPGNAGDPPGHDRPHGPDDRPTPEPNGAAGSSDAPSNGGSPGGRSGAGQGQGTSA
jgi:hypothetical protein